MSETGTALAVIGALTPKVIFGSEGGVDAILEKIRAEVRGTKADISTKAGRDQIRSVAYKIARSKTLLDNMGKDLVADLKAQTGAVDAERRRIRDELDALQEEFRKPLSDFEDTEKRRIEAHEAALREIADHGSLTLPLDTTAIADRLSRVQALHHNRDWQEFAARAAETRAVAIEGLTQMHEEAFERERADAEAESRRQEEVARRQQERDERLKAEAADRARKEAEEKAAAEAAAAAERARRERDAVEAAARQQQEAAEAAAQAERAAREKAEREKAAAEARARQAEENRIAAERRAREEAETAARRADQERVAAAEKAERDRLAAVEAERRRAEAERKRAEDEAAAREANRRHRGKINGEARDALIAGGLSEGAAVAAITLIAERKIPHVAISY